MQLTECIVRSLVIWSVINPSSPLNIVNVEWVWQPLCNASCHETEKDAGDKLATIIELWYQGAPASADKMEKNGGRHYVNVMASDMWIYVSHIYTHIHTCIAINLCMQNNNYLTKGIIDECRGMWYSSGVVISWLIRKPGYTYSQNSTAMEG